MPSQPINDQLSSEPEETVQEIGASDALITPDPQRTTQDIQNVTAASPNQTQNHETSFSKYALRPSFQGFKVPDGERPKTSQNPGSYNYPQQMREK